jgi:hypothetical protein
VSLFRSQKKLQTLSVEDMRPAAARLFLQLFLYANGRSKAIRKGAEAGEGGWVRHSESLQGLGTLWGMALDARDKEVSETAVQLLIELHHRFSTKLKARAERLRGSLVETCLVRIRESVPRLVGEEPNGSEALEARRVVRSITLLSRFLERFREVPVTPGPKAQPVLLTIQAGKAEAMALELKLPPTTLIRHLREKVASHFNEPPMNVLLYRKASQRFGAAQTKLERDDATFEEEELTGSVTVLAKKNDPTTGGSQPKTTPTPATDLIVPADLEEAPPDQQPFGGDAWVWLVSTPEDVGRLPPPLPHKPDMVFSPTSKMRAPLPSPAKEDSGSGAAVGGAPALPAEMPLASLLKQNPQYLDQLFQLLELDASVQQRLAVDLRAAVWDILQSLPTHPSVLADIRSLAFLERGRWDNLFRERSIYRLLYLLQVRDRLDHHVASMPALT